MRASQKTSPLRATSKDNRSASKKKYSGCGLSGQRHKLNSKSAILGVTKPDIRRLARKAGIKRIGLDTYGEAKVALTSFLRTVLKDVGVITEGARRMTVTVPDVLLALKRNGRTLYGFGEINSLDQYATRIRKPVKPDALKRAAALVQRRRLPQMSSSPQATQDSPQPRSAARLITPSHKFHNDDGQDEAEADPLRAESQAGAATQSCASLSHSTDMVAATPMTPTQESAILLSEEMREHIQGSVGEYVSKVYQYDPPGSVYKMKDLHSWVVCQYFQRKGLQCCSPEQLQTVLYALDEEGQVMISNEDDDLQIRFVM